MYPEPFINLIVSPNYGYERLSIISSILLKKNGYVLQEASERAALGGDAIGNSNPDTAIVAGERNAFAETQRFYDCICILRIR